jgi:hypothetical protein
MPDDPNVLYNECIVETRKKFANWTLFLVLAGMVWGQIVLAAGTRRASTPNHLTTFCAIETAGLYTLALFLTRRWWLPRLAHHPALSAPVLGVFNAGLIEAEFWAYERLFGGSGISASPNLLLDWLFTMPWYIGMVFLFVRGQKRSRFPTVVLLLLAGLYEAGADGVVGGQIVPWISGHPVALLSSWVFLVSIAFWEFILVYSSMVLPPAWVIAAASPGESSSRRLWRDALLPLVWLVPYTVYLVLILIAIGHR